MDDKIVIVLSDKDDGTDEQEVGFKCNLCIFYINVFFLVL